MLTRAQIQRLAQRNGSGLQAQERDDIPSGEDQLGNRPAPPPTTFRDLGDGCASPGAPSSPYPICGLISRSTFMVSQILLLCGKIA